MFKREGTTGRDTELLSAYIDKRLNASERAQLEARLAAEPTLRAELEELSRVVQAVHALPRRPVPRSFALNPQRYAPRQTWLTRIYPSLRVATTAVALMFIVVLGGIIVSQVSTANLAMAPAAAPQSGPADTQATGMAQAPAEPAATVASAETGDASKKTGTAESPPALPAEAAGTPTPEAEAGGRAAVTPDASAQITSSQALSMSVPTTIEAPGAAPAPLVATEPAAGDYAAVTPEPTATQGRGGTAAVAPGLDIKPVAGVLGGVFIVLLIASAIARRQMGR